MSGFFLFEITMIEHLEGLNLPCVLPHFQCLNIFLEGVHVLLFSDRYLYQTIVWKEPRCTIYVRRKIIYACQEQKRSKNMHCDTPDSTCSSEEIRPSQATLCIRFVTKSLIHSCRLFLIP